MGMVVQAAVILFLLRGKPNKQTLKKRNKQTKTKKPQHPNKTNKSNRKQTSRANPQTDYALFSV